ncbi:MAG TPA: hypothetical protein PKH16_02975 [Aequorivita sp.]|jgi:hypothetical protein|nr:hypothetical protein [Aequorivita sp.]
MENHFEIILWLAALGVFYKLVVFVLCCCLPEKRLKLLSKCLSLDKPKPFIYIGIPLKLLAKLTGKMDDKGT